MLDLMNIFAYGPPGGIDTSPALFWVSLWTAILGTILYLSLYYPQWPEVEEEGH